MRQAAEVFTILNLRRGFFRVSHNTIAPNLLFYLLRVGVSSLDEALGLVPDGGELLLVGLDGGEEGVELLDEDLHVLDIRAVVLAGRSRRALAQPLGHLREARMFIKEESKMTSSRIYHSIKYHSNMFTSTASLINLKRVWASVRPLARASRCFSSSS